MLDPVWLSIMWWKAMTEVSMLPYYIALTGLQERANIQEKQIKDITEALRKEGIF